MSSDPLDPVIQFHQQLRRLLVAGMALEFQSDKPIRRLSQLNPLLQTAEDALRVRVDLQQPITDAISAERCLSARYREALLAWVETSDLSRSAAFLTEPALVTRESVSRTRIALIRPLFLVVMALLAFAVLLQFTVPRWERFDALEITTSSVRVVQPFSRTLELLKTVREALFVRLSYWQATVIVVAGLMLFLLGRRVWNLLYHSQVSQSLLGSAKRSRSFAQQARSFAGDQARLKPSARHANATDMALPDGTSDSSKLMNWVSEQHIAPEELPEVYRAIASCYDAIAEAHERSWRTRWPAVAVTAMGAVLVLLYGLCLFLPLVDAMVALTR